MTAVENTGLQGRALLVDLNITCWTGRREDKEAAGAIATKYGSDPRMGKFRKYLIDPDEINPIINFATGTRDIHRAITAPWTDRGPRILVASKIFDYNRIMRERKDTWEGMVLNLFTRFDFLVEDARRSLNGLWRASDYPSKSRLRDLFTFEWYPEPVGTSFTGTLGEVIGIQQAEIDRMQRELEARNAARVRDAMQDVARRIREVVSHVSERLAAYKPAAGDDRAAGVFRDSLVENVKALAAVIPMLNITGDPLLDEVAGRMQAELCAIAPDTLRESPAARNQVQAAADEILQMMGDFVA